jgi:hypothetical protein
MLAPAHEDNQPAQSGEGPKPWDARPQDFGFQQNGESDQNGESKTQGEEPNIFGLKVPGWVFGSGGGEAQEPATQDANLFGLKMPSWVFGDGDRGQAAPQQAQQHGQSYSQIPDPWGSPQSQPPQQHHQLQQQQYEQPPQYQSQNYQQQFAPSPASAPLAPAPQSMPQAALPAGWTSATDSASGITVRAVWGVFSAFHLP